MWCIWLIAGPSADDVLWFISLTTSFTTDFGNEMHLLEMPDVVDALMAWADGVPLSRVQPLVHHDRRLFARALRVAGWSHTLGGIMKSVASKFKDWPEHLSSLRIICKTFRNESYREHVKSKLKRNLSDEEKKTLKSFTAGFAKWRYETGSAAADPCLREHLWEDSCFSFYQRARSSGDEGIFLLNQK